MRHPLASAQAGTSPSGPAPAGLPLGLPVRPLRVMHLVYRLQEGGMEQGVTKLVNGLRGSGIASSICSTVPATRVRALVSPEVPLFELDRRPGNDPALVWHLYHLLRRERPHILHTHSWGTLCEGLTAARLARVPLVVHGEHGTLQTKTHQLRVQRWAWQRVDRLLAVSSRLADRMSAVVDVPRARIQVVRNGVDCNRFGSVRRSAARLRIGAPHDVPVIGTVGRLVDVKGHATLLAALQLLAAGGRPFLAVIAGEGPLRPALEAQIAALDLQDRVRLLGHCHDIETVLAGFDVFTLPSYSEGMANTLLEAMASALPIVATRVGGADEVIENGRTGILVEPRDPAALATELSELLINRDARETLGAAARARAEREFSLEAMIEAYQRLYLDAAGERHLDAAAPEGPPCAG